MDGIYPGKYAAYRNTIRNQSKALPEKAQTKQQNFSAKYTHTQKKRKTIRKGNNKE